MNVTRASVICEAASRPHYSQLAAVPLVSRISRSQSHSFCFLHSVLPREVSSKLKRDFSVFTEDIKINNVQLHSWSLGTSRKKILSIGRSSIACLSSQAHLSCLVLLSGCNQGATRFLLRVQCLQFQSNTLTVPVIAFSLIANSTPRYWDLKRTPTKCYKTMSPPSGACICNNKSMSLHFYTPVYFKSSFHAK